MKSVITKTNQPRVAPLHIIEVESWGVAAWCPDLEGKEPPEQVHLTFHLKVVDTPPLVLRFKSPETIGIMIEQLQEYRDEVWGDGQDRL